jgi:hypothetical protein
MINIQASLKKYKKKKEDFLTGPGEADETRRAIMGNGAQTGGEEGRRRRSRRRRDV